jgi:hypothetical protein
MATRGCTSKAASRDPQVFRVPCTVILGTCRPGDAAIEAAAWLELHQALLLDFVANR